VCSGACVWRGAGVNTPRSNHKSKPAPNLEHNPTMFTENRHLPEFKSGDIKLKFLSRIRIGPLYEFSMSSYEFT
jgi:hypothetical protein